MKNILTLGATYRETYTGETGQLVFIEDGDGSRRTCVLDTGRREVATNAARLELLAPASGLVASVYERLTGPTFGGIEGRSVAA